MLETCLFSNQCLLSREYGNEIQTRDQIRTRAPGLTMYPRFLDVFAYGSRHFCKDIAVEGNHYCSGGNQHVFIIRWCKRGRKGYVFPYVMELYGEREVLKRTRKK